jgi:pentatricopeptide repeat protein
MSEDIANFARDVFAYTKNRESKPKLKDSILTQRKDIEKRLGDSLPLQYIRPLAFFLAHENEGDALVALTKRVAKEPNATRAAVMEAKVRYYVNNKHNEYATQEATEIRKLGEPLTLNSYLAMLYHFNDSRDYLRILELWQEMKDLPGIRSRPYEIVMRALVESGEYYEAIRLINKIEAEGIEVEPAIYYSSCIAYVTLDDLPMALESFVKLQKSSETPDLVNRATVALVRLAIRTNKPAIFEELFAYVRNIADVNEPTISSMMSLANRHNLAHRCMGPVLAEFRRRKFSPTPMSKSIFLSALDQVEEKDPVLFLTLQQEFEAWAGHTNTIEMDEQASALE